MILEQLLVSNEIEDSIVAVATPRAWLHILGGRAEVGEIRRALASGELSEQGIREYLAVLLRDFCPGQRFQHEASLALVVVAVSLTAMQWVESFIEDMAKVAIRELPIAPRVAALVQESRRSMARNESRRFAPAKPLEVLLENRPVHTRDIVIGKSVRTDGANCTFAKAA